MSNRDKGTRFEQLCLDFLTHDKTYKDQFLKVKTFKDWASSHPHLAVNGKDTGIDLVATNNPNYDNTVGESNADSETFTAIQCKFYAKDTIVYKDGIDSFIIASSKIYFTQRLIIATNKEWSSNVLEELYDPHSTILVNITTRIDLEHSSIDWGSYQLDPSEIKYLERELRPYQVAAVEDVLKGFRSNDRGQLIMTCGTGKTYTAFDYVEKAQCFPRYVYRKQETAAVTPEKAAFGLLAIIEGQTETESETVINGYVREDAIRPEAVEYFRQAYPEHADAINANSIFYYVYGLLHSTEYRSIYANNLQKELPRIPRVATYEAFAAFEQAGRQLAKLHVGYESVEPYTGCTIVQHIMSTDYEVTQMKYGKIAGKSGNAGKDKTIIHFNDNITIRDIPLEVQEYVVSHRLALDWVVDRCCISKDADSKIVNNYNNYACEVGDSLYILNLVLRVITVSLETMKIVKGLPKL